MANSAVFEINASKVQTVKMVADLLGYQFSHSRDGQLLCQEADRWVDEFPVLARLLIGALGLSLTLHFGNFIPDRYDVVSKKFWRRFSRR